MSMPLRLAFDRQIQQRQRLGGISRYFRDLSAEFGADSQLQLLPPDRRSRSLADVVHATFYGGRPYRLRPDQALVSSLFDMTPERHPEHFLVLPGLRSPHANKARWFAASDRILSISAASADDLAFYQPGLRTPIDVVPLATAIATVMPTPVPELVGRRFWLLVGKRHAYKNVHTLLRALALLQPQADWPLLVCAGGGRWRHQERHWLHAHGLLPVLRQLPAADPQLAWLYGHAEAVLVPSLAEGFSLPLIEALACNAPVIASDLEVHREVAGRYATLLPALNARAWAELLATAARSPLPKPKEVLGRAGWEQLEKFYGIARLVHQHKQIYTHLAG